jgi:hypothetical protein
MLRSRELFSLEVSGWAGYLARGGALAWEAVDLEPARRLPNASIYGPRSNGVGSHGYHPIEARSWRRTKLEDLRVA